MSWSEGLINWHIRWLVFVNVTLLLQIAGWIMNKITLQLINHKKQSKYVGQVNYNQIILIV